LRTKNHNIELSLCGVVGGFRLRVGAATQRTFAGQIRFDRDVTEDKNMDLQLGASRSASRNEI
jgi:hypothetical protein